ncbi:hypothetical protein GOM49_07100 [Clostridium bovifaecis]|uniref:Uncharacterized protein n=1 Tax=Clostridium bovifaecis TaxID=2184719 RepID=A0A6I6F385_9CLOT|nr:hypothetical protein GOM49_07100 [Clostridium bovifaecis]
MPELQNNDYKIVSSSSVVKYLRDIEKGNNYNVMDGNTSSNISNSNKTNYSLILVLATLGTIFIARYRYKTTK